MPMPADVQDRKIHNSFKLTKVGVKDVRKPVRVRRDGKSLTLTATFDIFVDLPASQKGSHLSRNLEIVAEIVNESVRSPMPGLEFAAEKIAVELLNRHSYASNSEVWARAEYFLERTGPGGRKSLEPYELVAKAWAHRNKPIAVCKAIGVKVVGMTACPCAMETVRHELTSRKPALAKQCGDIPMISHNQRNRTTLMLEVPEEAEVEANDLVELVESSLSSPTYGILKRKDEGNVVLNAHRNPKFVEDVVRDILGKLLKKYKDLDDSVHVTVRSVSEESIHKHNALAERVTTLGELRKK